MSLKLYVGPEVFQVVDLVAISNTECQVWAGDSLLFSGSDSACWGYIRRGRV